MKKLLILIAFSILLLGTTGYAIAHGNIDQFSPGPGSGGIGIQTTENNGQSFTPTADNIIAFEIELRQTASVLTEPLTVRIREGEGLGGTQLGITQTHTGLPGVGNTALVHFDFPDTISLMPGNLYTFTMTLNDQNDFAKISTTHDGGTNQYPDGISFRNTNLDSDDYIFTTFFEESVQFVGGELIPIESTSLILAGAQSFSWMIPVLLSGIGIGLFAVSRKSE